MAVAMPSHGPPEPAGQSSGNTSDPTTTITITVREDGSAVWEVTHEVDLDDFKDEQAFREYSSTLNESGSQLDAFRGDMRTAVRAAEDATGREMNATGFTITAYIVEEYTGEKDGRITFRFVWNGFARETEYGLTVGDAFEGGFHIEKTEELRIIGPRDMEARATVPATTTDGSKVVWRGERSFGDQRPHVEFIDSNADIGFSSSYNPVRVLLLTGGLVVAGLAAVAGSYVVITRRLGPE